MELADRKRIDAFKSAMLNTCVRAMRDAFENLTLSNCMDSVEFRAASLIALNMPLLSQPIEPAMKLARKELIREIES